LLDTCINNILVHVNTNTNLVRHMYEQYTSTREYKYEPC
jgi:ASC-1-like (ASCH) protein